MKHRFTGMAIVWANSFTATLAGAATVSAAAPAASPVTHQMTSLVISTLVITGLIVAAAWILKRVTPRHYARDNLLRVVAGAAVGQRERVVVVEIGATWLVLGVAPGHVNVLHQLPRTEPSADAVEPVNRPHAFTQWLTKAVKKTQ